MGFVADGKEKKRGEEPVLNLCTYGRCPGLPTYLSTLGKRAPGKPSEGAKREERRTELMIFGL